MISTTTTCLFLSSVLNIKYLTYSMVIWDTTSKLVKPSLAKFSLYWPILMASSHSSTVLKDEKSGVLRSSRGKWTLENKEKTKEDHINSEKFEFLGLWVIHSVTWCRSFLLYLDDRGVMALRLLGLRIILSRVLTIWLNLGRLLRSFCQQSSISWCSALGQSIGGGNL